MEAALGRSHKQTVIAGEPRAAAPSCPRVTYLQAAPDLLGNALDRLFRELATLPDRPTPAEVRATPLRHRMLELRLLMDFCAFAYEPEPLKIFREIVDAAYRRIGEYQDLCVAERILRTSVSEEVVNRRLLRMDVALAPLRGHEVQDAAECFLTGRCSGLRLLVRKQVPHIWSDAESIPSSDLDADGNLAHLAARMLRELRDQGVPEVDIRVDEQEDAVHAFRKAVRAAVTLTDLSSTTRRDVSRLKAPLLALMHCYGEVHDCVIACHTAREIGQDTCNQVQALVERFEAARQEHRAILDQGGFDAVITRLELIENEHHSVATLATA